MLLHYCLKPLLQGLMSFNECHGQRKKTLCNVTSANIILCGTLVQNAMQTAADLQLLSAELRGAPQVASCFPAAIMAGLPIARLYPFPRPDWVRHHP